MYCYFVIARPPSALESHIIRHYTPNVHVVVPDTVWCIATRDDATSADVCNRLGMDMPIGPDFNAGVVVKADQYYGAYDPALWQRLSQWESAA